MSTIDDVLRKIGSGRFISVFDAKSGYWQVPVKEKDRWLTAFVTHDGLYEWLRMPFGLKNACHFCACCAICVAPDKRFF